MMLYNFTRGLSFSVVREFLSGQPLIEFVESPFYWRFLQWKYLERYE